MLDFISAVSSSIDSTDFYLYLIYLSIFLGFIYHRVIFLNKVNAIIHSIDNDCFLYKGYFSSEYNQDHKDKQFFSPFKVIYPVVFNSLSNITKVELLFLKYAPEGMLECLHGFSYKIGIFNMLIDKQKLLVTANQKDCVTLHRKLIEFGINDDNVTFDDFREKIEGLKKTYPNLEALAQNCCSINNEIHLGIIGSRKDGSSLHYVWNATNKGLLVIIKKNREERAFFKKYQHFFLGISFIIFLAIEYFF